jgi:hypothetical protein
VKAGRQLAYTPSAFKPLRVHIGGATYMLYIGVRTQHDQACCHPHVRSGSGVHAPQEPWPSFADGMRSAFHDPGTQRALITSSPDAARGGSFTGEHWARGLNAVLVAPVQVVWWWLLCICMYPMYALCIVPAYMMVS